MLMPKKGRANAVRASPEKWKTNGASHAPLGDLNGAQPPRGRRSVLSLETDSVYSLEISCGRSVRKSATAHHKRQTPFLAMENSLGIIINNSTAWC
jgi:hypothetical protein